MSGGRGERGIEALILVSWDVKVLVVVERDIGSCRLFSARRGAC